MSSKYLYLIKIQKWLVNVNTNLEWIAFCFSLISCNRILWLKFENDSFAKYLNLYSHTFSDESGIIKLIKAEFDSLKICICKTLEMVYHLIKIQIILK